MILAVGTNSSFEQVWQSPDLPSPTITTADQKTGGGGGLKRVMELSEFQT
jgi:hypothetical protein